MVGLIGKKLGMTQVFDAEGQLTPVTVIQIEPNVVIASRTIERDGYSAVVLGALEQKASRISKPLAGQFKADVSPKKHLLEVRDFDKDCSIGDSIGVEIFDGLRYLDVVGTSKGKGFQGVIKRHGFSGGRDTHGSKFHRSHGSTGNNTFPARVFKGMKMAGRMGGERKTVQNLRVVMIDKDKQVVLVKGAVPGSRNSMVVISNAKKKG
jgi:large subunit ribosomal protein L3